MSTVTSSSSSSVCIPTRTVIGPPSVAYHSTNHLLIDLWRSSLAFLDAPSLLVLQTTNRYFHSLSIDPITWKRIRVWLTCRSNDAEEKHHHLHDPHIPTLNLSTNFLVPSIIHRPNMQLTWSLVRELDVWIQGAEPEYVWEIASHLKYFPRLEHLTIWVDCDCDCPLDDDNGVELFQSLSLHNPRLKSLRFDILVYSKKIGSKTLRLYDTSERALQALCSISSLQTIDVSFESNNSSLELLTRSLPNLVMFTISTSWDTQLSLKALNYVASLQHLKYLDVKNVRCIATNINNAFVDFTSAVAMMKQLRVLGVRVNGGGSEYDVAFSSSGGSEEFECAVVVVLSYYGCT
jgi:hypothetical protein